MFTRIVGKLTASIISQLTVFVAVSTFTSGVALSNPMGGVATPGTTISNPSPNTLQVTQGTDKAIINWQTFNIANGEKTQFVQPNASSIALNRVNPTNGVSSIYGSLTANGRIVLINQAGIYFGPNSHVDVASLIASTSDISDDNFLNGNFKFDRPSSFPNAGVTNEGTIRTANYGLVALMGQQVRNDGTIQARLGTVALGAGNTFTLDFDGDQLVNFAVTSEAPKANVTNTGSLVADGGTIIVSAKAARGVVDNVINMGGVAEARSVGVHNGEIILGGGANGTVSVTGRLIASGHRRVRVASRKVQHHITGGTVHISGNQINIASTASIDVSGDNGGGTVLIGGDEHGANIVDSINGGPTTTETNAQSVYVDKGATINASSIEDGDGGKVIAWSDGANIFYANIINEGGLDSGNGGFVETSGHYLDVNGASVSTKATNGTTGTWLLDPSNITICAVGSCPIGLPDAAGTNGVPGSPAYTFSPNNNTDSIITMATLQTALNSTVVQIQTASSGTSDGNITIDGNLNLGPLSHPLILQADNNINVNGDITTPSNISFAAGVSNPNGMTIFNGNHSVTTVGNQFYDGKVELNGDATLTSTNGAIWLTNGVITSTPGQNSLTLSSNGNNNVVGDIGSANSRLKNVIISTTSGFNYLNNVYTAGLQTYNGPTVMGGNNYSTQGGLFTVNGTSFLNNSVTVDTRDTQGNGGEVNFNDIEGVKSSNLTLDAGNGTVNFNGNIGDQSPLQSLEVNAQNINFNLTGNDVITQGSQTYNGLVNNTDAYSTVFATDNGNIAFNDGLSGAYALVQGNGGNTFTFQGDINMSTRETETGAVNIIDFNTNGAGENTLFVNTNLATQNWNITSNYAGYLDVNLLNPTPAGFTFDGVQHLIGGNHSNNFIFGPNTTTKSINSIDGGISPTDLLDFTQMPTPVTVNIYGPGTFHGSKGNVDFPFDDIDIFKITPPSIIIGPPVQPGAGNGNGSGNNTNGYINPVNTNTGLGVMFAEPTDPLWFFDQNDKIGGHTRVQQVKFNGSQGGFNIENLGDMLVRHVIFF